MDKIYPSEGCKLEPQQLPTVAGLLQNIQIQINEIGNGKIEIERCAHRLHDTNVPRSGKDEVADYSSDMIGVLRRINDELSGLREDFYAISNKLNNLI